MAGFDNDVIYGTGLDLSDTQPVANRLSTDGYLYFGSTSNQPAAGLLTSTNDTLVYTGADGAGRIENRRWMTPYVVDPSSSEGVRGTYQTIAAAFAAVSSGDLVVIRPGTYTENLTVPTGITVVAMGSGTLGIVKIVGTLTFTGAVSSLFSNIQFETNGAVIVSVGGSGTNQSRFDNCGFILSDSDLMTVNNASASPYFHNCFFNTTNAGSKLFTLTSSSQPTFSKCIMTSSAAPGTSTLASGTVFMRACSLGANIFSATGGGYRITDCDWDPNGNATFLTTTTAGSHTIVRSSFNSGTSACFSIGASTSLDLRGVTIKSTNSNPVTGGGTVTYTPILFGNTGYGINATTKTGYNLVAGGISFDHGTNLLSNYTVSSYVPTVYGSSTAGAGTYAFQQGRYTRVGNIVKVTANIQISAHTGSGTVRIDLPFTSANLSNSRHHGSAVYYDGTNYNPLICTNMPNTDYVQIQTVNASYGAGVSIASALRLYLITIVYEV